MASNTDIGLGKWKLLESGSEEKVWKEYQIYFHPVQRRFYYRALCHNNGLDNGTLFPGKIYFTLNVDQYEIANAGYAQHNATATDGQSYTTAARIYRNGQIRIFYNAPVKAWPFVSFYVDELQVFNFNI